MIHPCKADVAASKIITKTHCRSRQARHGAFLPQTMARVPASSPMLIKRMLCHISGGWEDHFSLPGLFFADMHRRP
jgi:hypothetical protein